jgi:ring-1,2-phenylacetyl-CoA epoxidase subunit PaaD
VVTEDEIARVIREVPDPELPFLSIEELGMVGNIVSDGAGNFTVELLPTYLGCPASDVILDSVKSAVSTWGSAVSVVWVGNPIWSTDRIGPEAREKMRIHGIAPPEGTTADRRFLTGTSTAVSCPRCGSRETRLVSPFGSTACKAHFACTACGEPFDHFKCI